MNLGQLNKNTQMEHNDLYKHLANVYISKPFGTKKTTKFKINPVFILLTINTAIICILLFVVILDRALRPNPFKITSYALNINDNDHPLKIKYSLCNPIGQKNNLSLYFDNIDLTAYKDIRLFVKSDNDLNKRIILLLHNNNGGKAVSFLTNITDKWKIFVVPLKSFDGIKDLSSVNKLTFGIENWSINNSRGQIYIGDITFLR